MSPAENNDSFIQDIFCCILNTLLKSRFGQKLMNWFKRETTEIFLFLFLKKKRKETRGAEINSLLFYLVTPPFPAKKGNRALSLSGTVKYYSSAVLWNSLPSSIRKAKSLANFLQMLSVSIN